MPHGRAIMGLTKFVDDESPLYAMVDANGNISDYKYGGEPFPGDVVVSAGVYALSDDVWKAVDDCGQRPRSLSEFQKILASQTDIPVRPFYFSKAFDIDCPHDRDVAEAFIREEEPYERIRDEYRASLKSMDTEEHIDLAFYRPLGFAWAILFRRLGVTPNAVTIASIFIGVAAGICFYPDKLWINIIGIFLLIWANTFDSCDGQLARLTGHYSPLGRILDGIAGDMWFLCIYIAICLRSVHTSAFFEEHNWTIWVMGALAGACHILQAAVADRYRQFHLFFLKGAKGSELDSSIEVARRFLSLSWEDNFVTKIIQFLYFRYTTFQERMTPQMQKFRLMLREKYENEHIPESVASEFRRLSLPLCKWENFMTFNWRTIFLFTSILVGLPWLYFVAELTVFNIVLVYIVRRHESICRMLFES